jgi:hypothetical protein
MNRKLLFLVVLIGALATGLIFAGCDNLTNTEVETES